MHARWQGRSSTHGGKADAACMHDGKAEPDRRPRAQSWDQARQTLPVDARELLPMSTSAKSLSSTLTCARAHSCTTLLVPPDVTPGVGWGTLDGGLRKRWMVSGCDAKLRTIAGTAAAAAIRKCVDVLKDTVH